MRYSITPNSPLPPSQPPGLNSNSYTKGMNKTFLFCRMVALFFLKPKDKKLSQHKYLDIKQDLCALQSYGSEHQ